MPDPYDFTEIIEYADVRGKWFDSNDVAEYMREKGLELDINSVYVDITVGQRQATQPSFANLGVKTDRSLWNPPAVTQCFRPYGISDMSFPEVISASDQLFAQSLGLPTLSSFTLDSPLETKKYLDVEKFVRCTYPPGLALVSS